MLDALRSRVRRVRRFGPSHYLGAFSVPCAAPGPAKSQLEAVRRVRHVRRRPRGMVRASRHLGGTSRRAGMPNVSRSHRLPHPRSRDSRAVRHLGRLRAGRSDSMVGPGWDQMTRPQYSGDWKKRRKIVLARDGHECQLRLPGCIGDASTVDHIVPVKLGGDQSMANLQAACGRCNSAKGDGRRNPGSSSRKVTLCLPRLPPSPRAPTRRTTHYEPGANR